MNNLKSITCFLWLVATCACTSPEIDHETTSIRAPAYPLITIDPYTSAWSMADHLYDVPLKHWTGKVHSLIGVAPVNYIVSSNKIW